MREKWIFRFGSEPPLLYYWLTMRSSSDANESGLSVSTMFDRAHTLAERVFYSGNMNGKCNFSYHDDIIGNLVTIGKVYKGWSVSSKVCRACIYTCIVGK